MDNTWEDYEQQCTCGDFKPYNPVGIVAALQPFGSCANCYHKPLGQTVWGDSREALDALLMDELTKIRTMTPEELKVRLYGCWVPLRGEQQEHLNKIYSSIIVPKELLGGNND